MKVIKKEPAKSVTKRKICTNCGVTLEYVPKDIREYHGTDISGGPDGRKWIVCPECGEEITLESW